MRGKNLFAGLLAAAVLCGCSPHDDYLSISREMLGTTLHVTADVGREHMVALSRAIGELDARAKASMSIFDENSLLSRLNRNLTDSVDAHITFNLHLADSIWRLSGGYYDVTVEPLVEAWGFAGKKASRRPNVDSILQFVGCDKVKIVGGRLVKADPRTRLDFNSVAKGYTVDRVAALVEEFGAENYIVEIGGELHCKGHNRAGDPWRIGIETPFDGNMSEGGFLTRKIRMSAGGLATSGNYRRFYVDESGRKVAHTINPLTGYSQLSRLLSATVCAPTCAEADALGTMFMALGAERALAFVKEHPEVKAYFIFAGSGDREYEEYVTPAMKDLIMNENE